MRQEKETGVNEESGTKEARAHTHSLNGERERMERERERDLNSHPT